MTGEGDVGILGKLFGGKARSEPSGTDTVDVGAMTLTEVLAHIPSLENPVFNEMSQAYRRLIDIGLFEHGYVDADRRVALQIADALKLDIIASCEGQPGGAEAFEEASAYHIGQARYYGFGSLQWFIDDAAIGASDLVDFVVRPEFADLLSDYLAMQPAETLAEVRFAFVRAMIAARREHADQTDLQVLFELVAAPDPAIGMLLPESELAIIRNAPGEYDAANLLADIYR